MVRLHHSDSSVFVDHIPVFPTGLKRAARWQQKPKGSSFRVLTSASPAQISLETERLGPRRVESLKKEDEEWQRKAGAAVLSIQDLTVKFFETTTRALKGKRHRALVLMLFC